MNKFDVAAHKAKVLVNYSRLLRANRPMKELPGYIESTYNFILDHLPRNHQDMVLADIGSGLGIYEALLYPVWKSIISIEPHRPFLEKQVEFVSYFKPNNIEVIESFVPQCIETLEADAILCITSIYLTKDWLSNSNALLKNKKVKWFCIVDGIDKDTKSYGSTGWKTPAEDLTVRRPMEANAEWLLTNAASELGFDSIVYDVDNGQIVNEGHTCSNWIVLGNRKENYNG